MKNINSTYKSSIALTILCISLLSFHLTGCGGSFKRGAGDEIAGTESAPKPEYDPLGLADDKTIAPEKYQITSLATGNESGVDSVRIPTRHYAERDSSSALYSRYRVQLFSTNKYGLAVRETKIAKEVFDKPVFLDYEVPYYKVRVGDFYSRIEAEDYLPASIQSGYNTAWVVKVALDVKTLEDIYTGDEIPALDIPDKPEDSLYQEPKAADEFQDDL